MAITEVITCSKILTENHLILPVNLFELNPKQIGYKNYKKEMCPLSFLPSVDVLERKMERGPRRRHGDSKESKGGDGVPSPRQWLVQDLGGVSLMFSYRD
jgi:hypothetical protein